MRELVSTGLAALAAGCFFDRRGVPADGDGDAPDGTRADAAICAELTARIRVDGIAHDSVTEPAVTVLVGDTVHLSSAGSCGPGPLRYAWDVSPVSGIRDTIHPAEDAAAITVFATLPDAYRVSLTVHSDGDASASTTIYAFAARGFAVLSVSPDKVRDLDVGGGQLWVASEQGTYRAPLAVPGVLVDVRAEASGTGPDALPNKTAAILWDEARTALWVGGFDAESGAWRVDRAVTPPVSSKLAFHGVLGGTARSHDLALVVEPTAATVALATERGTALASDGAAFTAAFVPPANAAATAGAVEAGETWILGAALHAVDRGRDFEVADGGTATGLVADPDGVLWAAYDTRGVFEVRRAGDDVTSTRHGTTEGLPSRNVRGLTVEPAGPFAGDVWVATDRGLGRWKADRRQWVEYGNPQGLRNHLDLRAVVVAVTASGGRTVFAGGAAGLVYAALP
jgi:hypothetical protein